MPNKQSRHQQGFNGPRVRDLNRALVLEAIRQDPGIGRAEIAASTRLTTATITDIVAALIGEGAVEESAEREARTTGQPVRSCASSPATRPRSACTSIMSSRPACWSTWPAT